MAKYYLSTNTLLETPVALHTIFSDDNALVFAGFGDATDVVRQFHEQYNASGTITPMQRTLACLHAMKRTPRGTEFQHQVWNAVTEVPAGVALTYCQLAQIIGRPKAFRAVGNALGRNPLTYFIPCHRVVRKSGEDLGYRWSPAVKKSLLTAEGFKL